MVSFERWANRRPKGTRLRKYIGRMVLRAMGWTPVGTAPQAMEHCVLVAAPHQGRPVRGPCEPLAVGRSASEASEDLVGGGSVRCAG